jgi:MtN3 and saliva related transmembrane protein
MVEWLGAIGGLIVVSSYIPQIVKLLRTKSSKDISALFVFSIMLGTLFLLVYSIHIKDMIFIIINAVASVMAGVVLILTLMYKRGMPTWK